MRTFSPWLILAAFGGLAFGGSGCSFFGREEARDLDRNATEIDSRAQESRTLGALVQLETALADYYKAEGRAPAKLEVLVPKYLGAMPVVELGIKGHRDNSDAVAYASEEILIGGQVDGSRLRDTGRWGYTFNDRQIVVFVDCTHSTSRGTPWFRERGVY